MLRLRQKHGNQFTFLDAFLPLELGELPDYHRGPGRPSVPTEIYRRMIALTHLLQ